MFVWRIFRVDSGSGSSPGWDCGSPGSRAQRVLLHVYVNTVMRKWGGHSLPVEECGEGFPHT